MNGALTAVWPGQPYPLGASWDGEGVNFALFSEHAERVGLCLFDQRGHRMTVRILMQWQTDQVWHCYVAALEYRADSVPGIYATLVGVVWVSVRHTGAYVG